MRDGSHRPPLVYNVVDESDTTAHCRSPRSHDHRGHVGRPDEGLERGGAGDDRRTLARGLRATLRSSSRHFAGTLAHEAPTPHGGVAPPAHEPDSRKRRPCCRIRVRVRLLEGIQAGYGGTAARDSLDRTLLVRLATGVKRSAPCVASFRRTPVHLGSRYRCCVKFTIELPLNVDVNQVPQSCPRKKNLPDFRSTTPNCVDSNASATNALFSFAPSSIQGRGA